MKNNIFIYITFSRLWKNEFRDLVNKVVEFMAQHNPVALKLEFVYTKLLEAQAELRKLQVPQSSNPATQEISEDNTKRRKLIRVILAQVRVLKSTNTIFPVNSLEIVSAFIKRYLAPILNSNSSKKNDILTEMFATLDKDLSLSNAIASLNLKKHFDELRAFNLSYNQKTMVRSTEKANRLKLQTADVRARAEVALSNVLKEIELMAMKNPELDYTLLVNSLNDTFASYMSQVKSRSTRRKSNTFVKMNAINATTTAQNGNSGTVAS